MAWDTLAVLMAAYESAEADSAFVDISEYTIHGRQFADHEMPAPQHAGAVFQRHH
jgi:hypothetical protein